MIEIEPARSQKPQRRRDRNKAGSSKDLSPGERLEYAALLERRAEEIRRAPRVR